MLINEVMDSQDYANSKQLKFMAGLLGDEIAGSQFKVKGKARGKPIPSIRVWEVTREELDAAAKKVGLKKLTPTETQLLLSSQFKHNIHSFKDGAGTVFSIVISTKGQGTGVGKKQLTPTKLGLAGQKFNRKELIKASQDSLKGVRDPKLKKILLKLIDSAVTRGRTKLDTKDLDYLGDSLAVISQDFGEVLAPIYVMSERDTAEFPSGNNPIVDVKIGKKSLAVKALTGSGNSFATVSDLLDRYEESIEDGDPNRAKFEIIKNFHKGTTGNVKDKIIRASLQAKTAEAEKARKIFGNINSFEELSKALSTIILSKNSSLDYGSFLKLIQPISVAGAWGKPVGMPQDANYYMTGVGNPPRQTQAGRASYDADPVAGGADIVTYMLGVGLLNQATQGKEAPEYNKIVTDILRKADAHLGRLQIDTDGSLKVVVVPFSDLNFKFQYHAPSHKPGNNAPGFVVAK